MKSKLRSKTALAGPEAAAARAWLKAAGVTDSELQRPLVAVVNSWGELAPENYHLRMVADAVKAGVRMAGGTPLEFGVIHVVDAMVMAADDSVDEETLNEVERSAFTRSTYDRAVESLNAVNDEIAELIQQTWGRP